MYDTTETDILETAGDLRVSLERETYAEEPDEEGQGFVFRLGERRSDRVELVHHDYEEKADGDAMADALRSALDHYSSRGIDWDMVERYLRAWHDVVSFDRDELDRSGPTYVFVATRSQARTWGLDPESEDKSYSDGESQADIVRGSAAGTLATWRQWAEGDVWSYTIERRHVWTDAEGEQLETWDVVDSLSGMYGRDYAEGEARAALASAAE